MGVVFFPWSFIGGHHVILGHTHHEWGNKSKRVWPKGCIMRRKVHNLHITDASLWNMCQLVITVLADCMLNIR